MTRPRGAVDPHPAVLMFHGYGGNSGIGVVSWPTLASGSAAALDCRGQGGSPRMQEEQATHLAGILSVVWTTLKGHPDNLLFRHIFLDIAQLVGSDGHA